MRAELRDDRAVLENRRRARDELWWCGGRGRERGEGVVQGVDGDCARWDGEGI